MSNLWTGERDSAALFTSGQSASSGWRYTRLEISAQLDGLLDGRHGRGTNSLKAGCSLGTGAAILPPPSGTLVVGPQLIVYGSA
jgi:hypothetical protein